MYFSVKAPITFSCGSTERKKQIFGPEKGLSRLFRLNASVKNYGQPDGVVTEEQRKMALTWLNNNPHYPQDAEKSLSEKEPR